MEYHNRRCNHAREVLFGVKTQLDIGKYLVPPSDGLLRCRVLYEREILSVEYLPYHPKNIQKIAFVEHPVEYAFKYADRKIFEQILKQLPGCDDAIIIRDGMLRDTTIANIAFLENGRWITPLNPLLEGTTRQRLIDEGFLTPRNIYLENIGQYDGFALMNAMVGFKIIDPIWIHI